MRSSSLRARRLATVPTVLFIAAAFAAPAAANPPGHATPGAADIGDPLFPGLGNGGYDALHYDLALTYPTSAPQQQVGGTVTMLAGATQDLSRFNLDFSGDAVRSVSVNGARAAFAFGGGELAITPRKALRRNAPFLVSVDFLSHTRVPTAADQGLPFGWFTTNDGSVMAGQPNFAHVIYPVNDHPADKASYSFRIDVPAGTEAVANGVSTGRWTSRGRTLWTYIMREPMASELVQVVVGDLAIVDRGRQHGVQVRDVASAAIAAAVEPALARTTDHLAWMEDQVGRSPFDTYGVLAADQQFFYALETQTLSLHPGFFLSPPTPAAAYEPVMVHELAHQWFGDDLAPVRWQDVWLNEGHADYYQQVYAQEFFFGDDYTVEYWRDAYRRANQLRHDFGPVAMPTGNDIFTLFSDNVYSGGSLVLYALRQVVGEDTLRDIEQTWVKRGD